LDEPRYKIGTVAKLTGLSPFLLRAWESRYDLLKPHRSDTNRRAYTQSDVETLRAVKRLLDRGYSIGEVASWTPEQIRTAAEGARRGAAEVPQRRLATDDGPPDRSEVDLFGAIRGRLLDAATMLDREAFETALADVSAAAPFGDVIAKVFMPLLQTVGHEWEAGDMSIASEHFVTSAIRQRLVAILHAMASSGGPQAAVACAPGDYHEIGALFVAYRLAREGWAVTFLGANLPASEFADAIGRLKPALVGLSIILQTPAESIAGWLGTIAAACPPGTKKLCGGAGARVHAELVLSYGFEVEG
jgi:MerR family transcriptional regulator, light-induced transcriptional regulator